MCATLWQITARYLRIEKLNFSMHSLFRFEKKKEKKWIKRGHRYFPHFCKVNNYCKKDKKISEMKSIFTSTRGQHLRELRLEISNKLSINYLKLLEIIIKKKARKKERKRRYVYAYKPLRFSNNLKSRIL